MIQLDLQAEASNIGQYCWKYFWLITFCIVVRIKRKPFYSTLDNLENSVFYSTLDNLGNSVGLN